MAVERNSYRDASTPAFGDVERWMCQNNDRVPQLVEGVDMPLRRAAHTLGLLQRAARSLMIDYEEEPSSKVSAADRDLHRFALGVDCLVETVGQAIEDTNRRIAEFANIEGTGSLVNLEGEEHWEQVEELFDAMGGDGVLKGQLVLSAALDLLLAQPDPIAFVARHLVCRGNAELRDDLPECRAMVWKLVGNRPPARMWPYGYAMREGADEAEATDAATGPAAKPNLREQIGRLIVKLDQLAKAMCGDERAHEFVKRIDGEIIAVAKEVIARLDAEAPPIEDTGEESETDPTEEPEAAEEAAATVEVAA